MAEQSVQIDTAVLDQFLEVVREQKVLDDFQARAEQMKGKVDEAVYRRVADDYAARLKALTTASEPLRARVRAEYERLRTAYQRLDQLNQHAWLEKQELEFRQQIGEIDAAQAAERLAGPTLAIEDCRAGMTRLEGYRARFVEAFGSEEALLGMSTRRIAAMPGSAADARTFDARGLLHVEGDGPDAADYALGSAARIGRSEENDICIQSRGLSRQHAIITATAKGFTLRDLESQNGTTVNGAPVTEHALCDGDVITVGDARLRFSMPARPSRNHPTSSTTFPTLPPPCR